MSDQILWPILAKYLAGECSQQEMSFMESWLEQEDNFTLFKEIENAWRNQQISEDDSAFDVSRGLALFYAKILNEKNRSTSE